jgi:hypothetical protein
VTTTTEKGTFLLYNNHSSPAGRSSTGWRKRKKKGGPGFLEVNENGGSISSVGTHTSPFLFPLERWAGVVAIYIYIALDKPNIYKNIGLWFFEWGPAAALG